MTRIALAILLLAATLPLAAGAASAHEPGTDWIMAEAATRWCCSQGRDCRPIDERELSETAPGTWLVISTGQVFREGERGIYPSRELVPWACRFSSGSVRCLFVVGKGS